MQESQPENSDNHKMALVLACQDLQIDLPRSKSEQEVSMEVLKEMLASVILELLNNDFAKLLNLLYRIDISEDKVSRVLHTSKRDRIGWDLAEMVVDRELQKLKTRKKYR